MIVIFSIARIISSTKPCLYIVSENEFKTREMQHHKKLDHILTWIYYWNLSPFSWILVKQLELNCFLLLDARNILAIDSGVVLILVQVWTLSYISPNIWFAPCKWTPFPYCFTKMQHVWTTSGDGSYFKTWGNIPFALYISLMLFWFTFSSKVSWYLSSRYYYEFEL